MKVEESQSTARFSLPVNFQCLKTPVDETVTVGLVVWFTRIAANKNQKTPRNRRAPNRALKTLLLPKPSIYLYNPLRLFLIFTYWLSTQALWLAISNRDRENYQKTNDCGERTKMNSQTSKQKRERERGVERTKRRTHKNQMIRWSLTWRVELLVLFKGSYREILLEMWIWVREKDRE